MTTIDQPQSFAGQCQICSKPFSFSKAKPLNSAEQSLVSRRSLCTPDLQAVKCPHCGSWKIFSQHEAQLIIEFRPGESPRDLPPEVLAARKKELRRGLMRFRVWRWVHRLLGQSSPPFAPSIGVRECSICETTWQTRHGAIRDSGILGLPNVASLSGGFSHIDVVGISCHFCGKSFCLLCYDQPLPKMLPGGECPRCGSKVTLG